MVELLDGWSGGVLEYWSDGVMEGWMHGLMDYIGLMQVTEIAGNL